MRLRAVMVYVLGALVGVLLIIAAIQRREPSDAVAGLVVLAVVAALTPYSLRRIQERFFPRVHDPAELAEQSVVVYFTPFSHETDRLRLTLGRFGKQARWVNLWRDPASAQRVRELLDGPETSPTVVLDGTLMLPLDPLELKDRLREMAHAGRDDHGPDDVTDDDGPATPGASGR